MELLGCFQLSVRLSFKAYLPRSNLRDPRNKRNWKGWEQVS